MAVYAAHLTRTLQGTPSIFQVTAQEALGATVKPALRKLVEYLAAVYPNKCGWCERWYDELYLVFDYLLQYHYLKHYAASFSESFYGLMRVPQAGGEFAGPRLPAAVEGRALALLVLAPYLGDKLQAAVDRWREQREDGQLGKSPGGRLLAAAVRLYSVVHVLSSSLRALQGAAYLTGRARSHAPELAMLGLSLKHAPPRSPQPDEPTWSDLFRSLVTGQIGSAVLTFPMVGGAVLRGVEYGAFAVQFLRWWEASSGQQAHALPTPPPPQRECPPRSKNRCPLCLRAWRVPTVLPVSGYIFCYVCISRHVRRHGQCPVSRCPAADTQLVRLYID